MVFFSYDGIPVTHVVEGYGDGGSWDELGECRPRSRRNQHGEHVVIFDLFEPGESWGEASREHIGEIFDEGGYDRERDNQTPLGVMIGSPYSAAIVTRESGCERVRAFDVTLQPPRTTNTMSAYYGVLSRLYDRGVPTECEVYSHPRTPLYQDTKGQVNVRSESCDLDVSTFVDFSLATWDRYRREYVELPDPTRYDRVTVGR